MANFQNKIDKTIQDRILADFFSYEKLPIVYDENIEGQKINDKGQFSIVPWYGPEASVSGMLHEMCHFAEREIEKLMKFPRSSWGFYHGKFWQIGTSWGYEPQTDQSVRREQMVWAYQLSAQRHYGIDQEPFDVISSATWLPAWCYYQPFPDERLYGLENRRENRRLVKLAEETELMSKNEFTFQAMQNAWDLRIEKLKDSIA